MSKELMRYQHQDTSMTLREGVLEYYAANAELIDPESGSEAAQELFRRHDVCHVLFGTDTSVVQEAMTDTWTMFGSDVGFYRYFEYLKAPEVRGILDDLGYWRSFVESVKSIPACLRAIFRAQRMNKPWRWHGYDRYWDVPLAEIREEFGIEVFQPEAT